MAGREAGNKDFYVGLNWDRFFFKGVVHFYHMFINNFDSVYDLSVVSDDMEEFAGFCACGDLGLVGALSELSPERIEH